MAILKCRLKHWPRVCVLPTGCVHSCILCYTWPHPQHSSGAFHLNLLDLQNCWDFIKLTNSDSSLWVSSPRLPLLSLIQGELDLHDAAFRHHWVQEGTDLWPDPPGPHGQVYERLWWPVSEGYTQTLGKSPLPFSTCVWIQLYMRPLVPQAWTFESKQQPVHHKLLHLRNQRNCLPRLVCPDQRGS